MLETSSSARIGEDFAFLQFRHVADSDGLIQKPRFLREILIIVSHVTSNFEVFSTKTEKFVKGTKFNIAQNQEFEVTTTQPEKNLQVVREITLAK